MHIIIRATQPSENVRHDDPVYCSRSFFPPLVLAFPQYFYRTLPCLSLPFPIHWSQLSVAVLVIARRKDKRNRNMTVVSLSCYRSRQQYGTIFLSLGAGVSILGNKILTNSFTYKKLVQYFHYVLCFCASFSCLFLES